MDIERETALALRFAALSADAQRSFLTKLQLSGLSFNELPIVQAQRPAPVPLSYAQRGLWLTWRMNPEDPAYNMAGVLRVKGRLNIDVLQSSLNALVRRHETLRTIYPAQDAAPCQQILDAWQMPLPCIDAPEMASRQHVDVIENLLRELFETPFQLDREPPIRAALYRIADDEFVLGISLHHIACDGWSVGIFVSELFEFYAAFHLGRTPAIAELPIQFADYAVWQRSWFEAGERERQLHYWQQRLGNDHPAMELPFDRGRRTGAGTSGADHKFRLPAGLSDQLRALARAQDVSLFMLMVALLNILLHRLSGQTDIRIGTPVANRQRAETHGLIGYLTNIQVLRTQLDPRLDFVALLRGVRETVLEAQQHQELPFDLLVDALQPQRQAGVHPLFQVKCTQLELSATRWSVAGLAVSAGDFAGTHAHFDLALDFLDDPEGIQCVFSYAAALFDRSTIERFATAFTYLATQVVDMPDSALALLELPPPRTALSDREKVEFSHPNILSMWDAVVDAHADRTAVRSEEKYLTYAELDARANSLAHELVAHGIGPEIRVGIYAERCCEFVLGLLAVLKAGGAYVPLDPQLPAARLACQLTDSGAQCLLAAQPPQWAVTIPVLPLTLQPAVNYVEGTVEAPSCPCADAQAAYVIYTSGSTGQPKGVVISRSALANYVQALLAKLALPDTASSMAMVSTVAADLGHTSLFGALCSGRTLHLVSAERAFDPDNFASYMRQQSVDVLKIVPTHLQALMQAGSAADVLPRHTLIVGGEALSWSLLAKIQQLSPTCRVLNHYGPTESTVGALTQLADHAHRAAATLPLGAPLANIEALVFDADLNPVLQGVAGELYLGGAGLARGYQGQPMLTSERFIAHPDGNGARLYRSGDRVRQHADGSLEFLGRSDDQIKIRGYRVELDEVRAAIIAQDGVRDAAVLAGNSGDGRDQLHAYVTTDTDQILDVERLRKKLATALPDYMIPAAIMQLEALPLTPNGKLDRQALPTPENLSPRQYEPPRGETETTLADIWCQLLGVDRIGRNDNFFTLGGDSILSLKVVARARKHGLTLLPRQLFEHRTLIEVAKSIDSRSASTAPASASAPVMLNASTAEAAPLFIIHDGWGSVLDYTALAASLADHCPVIGLPYRQSRGNDTPENLHDLARRHAATIKAVQKAGSYRICGWSLGGAVAPLVAGLLEGEGRQVDFVGVVDPYVQSPQQGAMADIGDDLKKFLAILLPKKWHETAWQNSEVRTKFDACLEGDHGAVRDLVDVIRCLVDAEQLHEYGALTSDELAEMFLTARALGSLAKIHCTPSSPLKAPVIVWWSKNSPDPERHQFSSWLSINILRNYTVDADHLEIIRDPAVLSWLAEEMRLISSPRRQTTGGRQRYLNL